MMDCEAYFEDMRRLRKSGSPKGIASACCANGLVIEAVMRLAKERGRTLLVEATANQVNQDGGYTGMRPLDFRRFVEGLADGCGFPRGRLMLGGDHLGPLAWRALSEAEAMGRAVALVEEYVRAGFDKIHLDTSMRLGGDDPGASLPDALIAERGARLCEAAESAHAACARDGTRAFAPVYVIGSEVPTPGGPQHGEAGEGGETGEGGEAGAPEATSPAACRASIEAYREAFGRRGLSGAWRRVVAFVVQPGVEFAGDVFYPYSPEKAKALCAVLDGEDGLVFEGHSTDYQPAGALRRMAEDGIAILKVGPALTFALREALMSLERIERALLRGSTAPLSDFSACLEHAMLSDESQWAGHYRGSGVEKRLARMYSFFDRARYYLGRPEVERAIERLLANLGARAPLPLPLLSQFMPMQFAKVCESGLEAAPRALLADCVQSRYDGYLSATAG
ncbi:MAG: class II D-tagatose-bisphosphate aldolase, non-catalytic subunit [Clostridiales bacterium]|jgi:D-tagatose-1,6-bisphosphate aldolase subunit GatZ/KbaZ|nr:class II D-tagatose-bisphosphate aldolase, non-catalytic subunit [Clostridiales bacterium]